MNMRPTVGLVAVLTLLVPTAWVGATDLQAAKENFATFCVLCHGKEGKGDGPSAATLATKPKDITDCARMNAIKDETVFTAIKEGGQAAGLSNDMPAWKEGMEDDEIRDLVAYIRGLCKK